MNDDHTDKATDKNVGDPTKSSGELEEILTEHNVYFWKVEGKTTHLDDVSLRAAFIDAVTNWHTTQTTKLQALDALKRSEHKIGEDGE